MKKNFILAALLVSIMLCSLMFMPAVAAAAVAAGSRQMQETSEGAIFTEMTLPDSATILFVVVQLDDPGSVTLAGQQPEIVEHAKIDLSLYSYVYYHETALGGDILAAKVLNVSESSWTDLTIHRKDPASGQMGDAPFGTYEIGSFVIEVTDVVRDQSYDDKDLISIVVNFTNNSTETISPSWALYYQAFQDGIEIDTGYMFGDNNISRDVRPGATLNDVRFSFEIMGTSPVTVELSDFSSYSFNEGLIELTFAVPD